MEWKLDGILPLYFKDESFPRKTDGEEILTQVEKIVGKKAKRCLRYGKTWLVYVNDNEARLKIIRVGLTIQGKKIQAFDRNPYILLDRYGNEIKTTKLVVSHLPPSIDSDEIVACLVEKGIAFHSKLMKEMMFLKDGTIHPRWETGNLFAYIAVPDKPLPSSLLVGKFKIKLRHREQIEEIVCNNCFQKGHYAKYCKNEIVCIDCQKPGHKRGDAACALFGNPADKEEKDDDSEDEDEYKEDNDDNVVVDDEENVEERDDEGKKDLEEHEESSDDERKENHEENNNMKGTGRSDKDLDLKQKGENPDNTKNDENLKSQQSDENQNEKITQNENSNQNDNPDNVNELSINNNKEGAKKTTNSESNKKKIEITNNKMLTQINKNNKKNPLKVKKDPKIDDNGERQSRSDRRGSITSYIDVQKNRSTSGKRKNPPGSAEPPSKKPNSL